MPGALTTFQRGRHGATDAIGGNSERGVLEVVDLNCLILDDLLPGSRHRPHSVLKQFVEDRPAPDRRYAIDSNKIRRETGWIPRENFENGLYQTIDWYLNNPDWCKAVRTAGAYNGGRMGLLPGLMAAAQ